MALDFLAILREERRKQKQSSQVLNENQSVIEHVSKAASSAREVKFDSDFDFMPRSLVNLSAYSVGPLENIAYIPDFVSYSEAASILGQANTPLIYLYSPL